MRAILSYFLTNTFELLIVGSLVLLTYSLCRKVLVNSLLTLTLSISPIVALWAYQNMLAGRLVVPT